MSVSDTPFNVQEQNFADDKRGNAQRLKMEFDAARKEHTRWQDVGRKIVERFLDRRQGEQSMPLNINTRWNVYTSSVQTKRAMLYGKPPTVDVRPRYADAPDSAARLAGDIAERLLNGDIERDEDGFKEALDLALMDRLNPGIAVLKFRYVPNWETVEGKPAQVGDDGQELAPEVPSYEQKSHEEVETDYIFWEDFLYSPCRNFREMRWAAFASDLSRDEVKAKFGEQLVDRIAYNSKKESGGTDARKADPLQRVRVWEVWDKEHYCVWWFCEAHDEVLVPIDLQRGEEDGDNQGKVNANGSLDDPLGLSNFWPFGKPWLANVTTSAFVPRADFIICQDILDEIDRVSTRITDIERAIGPKGVYDKTHPALARLLNEETNGKLIPVDNFAALAEKGGLNKAFELLDMKGLVEPLDRLTAYRQELLQAYYQISGDSDLTRGQQIENGTPGEAQVKAKFASVRMQAMQDEFARFASDAQAVRLEIIAKHFDPETIIARSNIMHSFDAESPALVQQAVELLKSDVSCYRVEVKPENVSLEDFTQVRLERSEVISSIASFIQTAAPLAQLAPGSMPYLLKMLAWLVSGLRGASTIEGVIDQAIAHAEQAAAQPQMAAGGPPQPDPKLLAVQAKAQADAQKTQQETQSELMRMQAETQQLAVRKANDARVNIAEEEAKARIKAAGAAAAAPMLPNGGVA